MSELMNANAVPSETKSLGFASKSSVGGVGCLGQNSRLIVLEIEMSLPVKTSIPKQIEDV